MGGRHCRLLLLTGCRWAMCFHMSLGLVELSWMDGTMVPVVLLLPSPLVPCLLHFTYHELPASSRTNVRPYCSRVTAWKGLKERAMLCFLGSAVYCCVSR